jgi:glycosyltransferase involved in cell wall biosynthesis
VRVLHARIVSGAGGGPEKTILASPRALERSGSRYRALAAYLHAPGDPGIPELARRAERAGCPLVTIPERLPIDLGVLKRLAALCREHDVRIWHGHDYKSNLYGLLLRKRLDLALVTTVHGWVERTRKTPLYFAVDRASIRRYDRVVCVSHDLFEQCAAFGVRAERLCEIPNAIDGVAFRRAGPPAAAAMRAELGTPPGRLVIGAAGRLSPEKGFDRLIEAVAQLVAEGRDLELWIAGEGGERARLEALRAALPDPGRVRLLGFVAEPREFFEALDVFCLSSLREGLPNVVLEAMAMEVPVVATRSGGMEAFARDGVDAVLVGLEGVRPLHDGLARVVGDAALRASLATAARARIERDFSFDLRMRRMVAVYDQLGV